MRSAVFSSFMLLALSFTTPAEAKSAFFLQLGSAASEQEAQAKWDKLREEYPALLKNMEFTSRSVSAIGGGETEYRIQAGPARSREQAQRACSTLMNRDVECYIVETAVFEGAPALARTTTSGKSGSEETKVAMVEAMPAPAENAVPAAEPESRPEPVKEKKESGGFFSFLPWNDDGEEEAKAAPPPEKPVEEQPKEDIMKAEVQPVTEAPPPPPPPEPARAASRVEIGEAIPVPLSIGEEKAPAPPQPVVTVTTREVPLPRTHARAENPEGKILVSGFTSEQAAFDFSNLLKSHVEATASARMQIARSLQRSNGRGAVSLGVSPVADAATAQAICDYAREHDEQLTCRNSSGNLLAQDDRRSGEAKWQPETAAALAGAQPHTEARSAFAGNPPSRFWVQLGSWRSQAEAVRRWQELKTANKDVLEGMSPNVSVPRKVSIGAKASVRLRAGPFDSRAGAESLCDRLSARGASCLVVPE